MRISGQGNGCAHPAIFEQRGARLRPPSRRAFRRDNRPQIGPSPVKTSTTFACRSAPPLSPLMLGEPIGLGQRVILAHEGSLFRHQCRPVRLFHITERLNAFAPAYLADKPFRECDERSLRLKAEGGPLLFGNGRAVTTVQAINHDAGHVALRSVAGISISHPAETPLAALAAEALQLAFPCKP